MWVRAVLIVAVVAVVLYLVVSASVALATIGKPRRALDGLTSVCLAVTRVALAVALVAAVL